LIVGKGKGRGKQPLGKARPRGDWPPPEFRQTEADLFEVRKRDSGNVLGE